MKWFKHETNASADSKLTKVRIKYGMEGYGLYWYLLELIGATVEPHNLNFELEHDAQIVAHNTGIHHERVEEMMLYMCNLGLFETDGSYITCLKMAVRSDEYTQKLLRKLSFAQKSPDNVRTLSGYAPDKVPSIRKEKKRKENTHLRTNDESVKTFEEFWNYYPKKKDKKRAMTMFLRLSKTNQLKAIEDIKAGRFADTEERFVPYPTTYLNGERWEDEKPVLVNTTQGNHWL